MKTASILTSLLLSFFFSVNAQQSETRRGGAAPELPQGWELSSNWLTTYRSNISPNGSASWILDKMTDESNLYSGKNFDGIVLVLEEEMEENTLAEAAEMAIIEANGTNLVPASDAYSFFEGYKADYHGKINGTPVFMEKTCLPSTKPGYMVTVLSISTRPGHGQNETFIAGNELASHLSSTNYSIAQN